MPGSMAAVKDDLQARFDFTAALQQFKLRQIRQPVGGAERTFFIYRQMDQGTEFLSLNTDAGPRKFGDGPGMIPVQVSHDYGFDIFCLPAKAAQYLIEMMVIIMHRSRVDSRNIGRVEPGIDQNCPAVIFIYDQKSVAGNIFNIGEKAHITHPHSKRTIINRVNQMIHCLSPLIFRWYLLNIFH